MFKSEVDLDCAITNCSAIIIGKKASKTGKVILGHNEDDINTLLQVHLVPRVKHEKGATITFPDGTSVIKEVPETLSYWWLESREIPGSRFADGFMNECGVVVATNSCVDSKVPEDGKFEGGIGYGMRRLIAERAHTAREGVEIVAELMKEYGYNSSRSYEICDANEGWVVQLTKGHEFVARRVGDDEVFYVPNWYNIHEIDFTDTKHKTFWWSEGIVDYAMKNGWYTPKKEGDYSDFDFAEAYQAGNYDGPSNRCRSDLAWRLLTGKKKPYKHFSVKAEKKYSIDEIKEIMRAHYDGHDKDLKKDPTMSPHRFGLCRDTTMQSMVIEFNAVTELTCMWMAFPRPCATPFIPWYCGATSVPKGYNWMGWRSAQASHFAVDESEFAYHSGRAVTAFKQLQNTMEFDYQFCEEKVHGDIAEFEKEMAVTKKAMDKVYLDLCKRYKKAATAMLTDYTTAQAEKAWTWAKETTLELTTMKDKANMNFWRSKL